MAVAGRVGVGGCVLHPDEQSAGGNNDDFFLPSATSALNHHGRDVFLVSAKTISAIVTLITVIDNKTLDAQLNAITQPKHLVVV